MLGCRGWRSVALTALRSSSDMHRLLDGGINGELLIVLCLQVVPIRVGFRLDGEGDILEPRPEGGGVIEKSTYIIGEKRNMVDQFDGSVVAGTISCLSHSTAIS